MANDIQIGVVVADMVLCAIGIAAAVMLPLAMLAGAAIWALQGVIRGDNDNGKPIGRDGPGAPR